MNKQVRRFVLAILSFHARQLVWSVALLSWRVRELGESWLLSHRSFGWFSTWPGEPVKSLLCAVSLREIVGHHTLVKYNKGSVDIPSGVASRPSLLRVYGLSQGLLPAL